MRFLSIDDSIPIWAQAGVAPWLNISMYRTSHYSCSILSASAWYSSCWYMRWQSWCSHTVIIRIQIRCASSCGRDQRKRLRFTSSEEKGELGSASSSKPLPSPPWPEKIADDPFHYTDWSWGNAWMVSLRWTALFSGENTMWEAAKLLLPFPCGWAPWEGERAQDHVCMDQDGSSAESLHQRCIACVRVPPLV